MNDMEKSRNAKYVTHVMQRGAWMPLLVWCIASSQAKDAKSDTFP